MRLLVGLGNPNTQYQNNRHNIGFQTIDFFVKFLENEGEFSGWKKEGRMESAVGKGKYQTHQFILAKPDTFMNNSGRAVKALLKKYKLAPERLVIIHDDIDIVIGSYKYAKNRGSAGHRGVQSIIDALGTKNFARIRIGIQPERGKPEDTNAFVMKNLTNAEIKKTSPVIEEIVQKFVSQTIL